VNATRVFEIGPAAADALAAALEKELPPDAEWRRVDHARFAVKAQGVNLVCYRSGKLVLQGSDLDGFSRRFLAGLRPAGSEQREDAELAFTTATIGSDEAGKGDYFGPLVVAAVHAEPAAATELAAMGVADSKTLGDQRMFPIAERIEQRFPVAVRSLAPVEYNARHRADPNVNHLLADLHAEALGELLQKHPAAAVVVDRFADASLVKSRLRTRGFTPRDFVMVPRAEAHVVVAAASIVARVHFLEGLRRCSEASGTELHKGAGSPVDAVARELFRIGGSKLLATVAKLHFKNSERVPGLRP
jgi:ribonuclease HIII